MTWAIELIDQQAQALAEAGRDLVSAPAVDFAAAAQRVLRKSEELYRRLA